jgi:hypothetical protein
MSFQGVASGASAEIQKTAGDEGVRKNWQTGDSPLASVKEPTPASVTD